MIKIKPSPDGAKDLPLRGKLIRKAILSLDEGGYGMVYIKFNDGAELCVKEISQTGEIEVQMETKNFSRIGP